MKLTTYLLTHWPLITYLLVPNYLLTNTKMVYQTLPKIHKFCNYMNKIVGMLVLC